MFKISSVSAKSVGTAANRASTMVFLVSRSEVSVALVKQGKPITVTGVVMRVLNAMALASNVPILRYISNMAIKEAAETPKALTTRYDTPANVAGKGVVIVSCVAESTDKI